MDEKRFSILYKGLFEAVLKGGFHAIAEAAYLYFNRPIMLLNIESKPLVQEPNQFIKDYVWDTLMAKKDLSSDFTREYSQEKLVQIHHAHSKAFFLNMPPEGTLPRILVNIYLNGCIQGFMAIICPDGHIDDEDLTAADIVAQAFSAEFRNHKNSLADTNSLIKIVIADLFQEGFQQKDGPPTEKFLQNLNIKPKYCIAAIDLVHFFGEKSLLISISKTIEEKFHEIYSTIIDDTIYLFITGISGQIIFKEFLCYIRDGLHNVIAEQYFYVGISNIFQNLSQFDKYKYQSEQSLFLGRKGGQEGNIFAYCDFVLTDIFSKVKDNMDPIHYLHPALALLKHYDYQHNTQYFDTLKIYITSICSTNKTTKSLHIHRNSLIYRLNKIKEITGLDLHNENTIAHLLCNFYLIR